MHICAIPSLLIAEVSHIDMGDWFRPNRASDILSYSLILGTLLLLVMCYRRPVLCDRLRAWLVPQPRPEESLTSKRGRNYWFWIGLLVVVAALVGLEVSQPYYFTQDDVLVGELPGVLWLCQSVWQGVVPEYNPYVLLGSPALSGGGGTYPITYLAYGIARHGLGNEFAMVEVFAILHLLVGYAATYWAARQVGLGRMPAMVVSLCFLLSGSVLIMGRSWHMFMPAVVWMPLLVVAVAKLTQGPVTWKWTLATGAVIGISFHGEFPQIWAYSVGFFVLAIAWLVLFGKIPMSRCLYALSALALGLSIAIPVLAVQMGLASDLKRPFGYGAGIGNGLLAMLLPHPLVWASHPNGWGSTDIQYMGHFYYFGTLLAVLFVANVVLLLATRPSRSIWAVHAWTLCACVAFLAGLGPDGVVWPLLTKVPVLGSINNNPFRMMPFFVLFASLSGGLLLERFLQCITNRRAWEIGVGSLVAVVMLYHVDLCRPTFYTYGFRPYPAISEDATRLLRSPDGSPNGRILSWAAKRSIMPSFAEALPLNLPIIYRLPAFTGYSPLVECMPPFLAALGKLHDDPTAAAQAYGVRWFLKHRSCTKPVYSPNPIAMNFEAHVKWGKDIERARFIKTHHLASSPDLEVLEVEKPASLAFAAIESNQALPVRYDGAGIDVDVRGVKSASPVTVNFLWYPKMKATIDGRSVECRRDAWYRMIVDVPSGAKTLSLRYCPGWTKGILIGLVLAALSIGAAFGVDRVSKRFDFSR